MKALVADVSEKCSLVLEEELSASWMVDPYEIENKQQHACATHAQGQCDRTYFLTINDIEAPQFNSTATRLLTQIPFECLRDDALLYCTARSVLPLHLRYHLPQHAASHVTATLNCPTVVLACSASHVLRLTVQSECSLQTTIPVGELQHYKLVQTATLAAVVIATLVLLVQMVLTRK